MTRERRRSDPTAQRQGREDSHCRHQERQHPIGDGPAQAQLVEAGGPQQMAWAKGGHLLVQVRQAAALEAQRR
jgi:hypothetical protein